MLQHNLRTQSMEFAVSIVKLVKTLEARNESVISGRLGKSGTSIGAYVHEVQAAVDRTDRTANLQRALKEADETAYWLELLYRTGDLSEEAYRALEDACSHLRRMLARAIRSTPRPQPDLRPAPAPAPEGGDILFADYMEQWLDVIKPSVAVPTFAAYAATVKKIVVPYFRQKAVTLRDLTAKDIQAFYLCQLARVSPSSVLHYHANIHKALKYAVKLDLIAVNPADKVERPKKDRYVGSFYDADEMSALFAAATGSKLELPILLGAFYGLRRSEVIGLKWDAIDFEQNTVTIRHTVTACDLDGKRILVAADTTKTKASMRTLPLVPFLRQRLLTLRTQQQENRRRQGSGYSTAYLDYVCVNERGDLLRPHYVTKTFPKLLQANGLRRIRYHDLRHSCASLLLANGVPMKQIQEWLGHSDFSTTANIYAHLDYSSKLTSADAMLSGLGLSSEEAEGNPDRAVPPR